jgi:hypothetical protein
MDLSQVRDHKAVKVKTYENRLKVTTRREGMTMKIRSRNIFTRTPAVPVLEGLSA